MNDSSAEIVQVGRSCPSETTRRRFIRQTVYFVFELSFIPATLSNEKVSHFQLFIQPTICLHYFVEQLNYINIVDTKTSPPYGMIQHNNFEISSNRNVKIPTANIHMNRC